MVDLRRSQLLDAVRVGNLDFLKQVARKSDLILALTPYDHKVIHVAAEFNQVECVKFILRLCPHLLYSWDNSRGDTALHIAARWGHVEIVQLLLAAAKTNSPHDERINWLRSTNWNIYTALHEAVFHHHLDVVEILLKEDPDADWDEAKGGESPLYLAIMRGYEDVGLLMMRCSLSDKLYQPNRSDGRNPLQAALVSNLSGVAAQILERMPHLAREKDKDGWTPLHWAVCCDSWTLIVAQLLSFDPSLAYKKVSMCEITPFHVAARMGSASSIKEFYTKSPFCCRILDSNKRNALHHAAIGGNKETILAILQIPWFIIHLNDRDCEGNTALHLLASFGHSHLMPLLSDHSEIDLFLVNKKGFTIHEIQQTRQLEGKYNVLDDNERRLSPRSHIPFNDDTPNKKWKQEYERKLKEEKKKGDLFREKVGQSHLVVAALIATVTFAAGFTLPGGYNDEGKAILFKRTAFVVFIISDTIALALSLLAVFTYFICATAQDPSDDEYINKEKMDGDIKDRGFSRFHEIIDALKDNLLYYEKLYRCGLYFTMSAIFTTTIVFVSGVYVSLGLSAVAITILAISASSLLASSFIFYKRYKLSPSKKNR